MSDAPPAEPALFAPPGLFVAFEGGEGVGKSTQIAIAAQWLRQLDHTVVETREPGGTALGRELRSLVLDPDGHVTARAEALLYAADRAQHVDTLIGPALERGDIVLSDRYVDSTLAYQGAGRGLADARLLTDWATGGLTPRLTVLLDLDPAVGLARAAARPDTRPDRLEATPLEFHQAVRREFLALAAAAPERYLVLAADAPAEDVARAVQQALLALLA